jgi:UDP-2,4-diacetamido-2,4,6-trideoxy-beta-L-altropyranose hydrolase
MNIVIRADASYQMGSGHMVRCLALANGLKGKGHHVSFLSQSLPGNLSPIVDKQGFVVHSLQPRNREIVHSNNNPAIANAESLGIDWQDDANQCVKALSAMQLEPDWLVVDHYALDSRWELAVKKFCNRILVIDDLANRPHDCDVLLDQVCTNTSEQYRGLIPDRCHLLLGGLYVLLRPEFAEARSEDEASVNHPDKRIVHVFFGTSDEPAHTIRFGRLLLANFPTLILRIAVGTTFKHVQKLVDLSQSFPGRVDWSQGVTNMARHMRGCWIAVGTPGMSTWERACMGLPAVHLTNSNSQTAILTSLKTTGFCDWLGSIDSISDKDFVSGISAFLDDESRLAAMREKGLAAIDGKGVQRAVADLTSLSP